MAHGLGHVVLSSPSTAGIETAKKKARTPASTPARGTPPEQQSQPSRKPPAPRGTPSPPPPLAEALDQHMQAGPGKGNFAKLDNYPPGYHFVCAADIARLVLLQREHAAQCAGTLYLRATSVSTDV